MHYGIENEEDEKIESARELLASPSQISALETVLYKVVEFYTRATKEHESAVQWQAKFAANTQQISEIVKKMAVTQAGIEESMRRTLGQVTKDAEKMLNDAALIAADKKLGNIALRFATVFEDGERQLRAYAIESKTFLWKLAITSIASSLFTALIILVCLVPTLRHQWLPLTNSQLEELVIGSELQHQWLSTPEKEKKKLREFLGEGMAPFYLDKNSGAQK